MIPAPGPAGGTRAGLWDPGAVKESLAHPYAQTPNES